MPRGGGMKMLRGAPKYFLALKGGLWKFSIYWRGAPNFSKFWTSGGLECSHQCTVDSHHVTVNCWLPP
jgi:hypothetical protein